MASIQIAEVYSRFFSKAEAFDLISADGDRREIVDDLLSEWLRSALYYPHIQKLFSSYDIDSEEGVINYVMAYPINDAYDQDFVLEVLSYGMVYGWINPKVTSITNITQFFGETDSKYYSQASHLSELRALRDDVEIKIRRLIQSRGFFKNQYLDGTSASANLR